mgnify:CR=1 FL=1
MKKVKILYSKEAKAVIEYIGNNSLFSKLDLSMHKAIQRKLEILSENPFAGENIHKKLIPQKYKIQGVTNLYRLELPNFWRILYTIKDNKIEILAIILEVVNHKEYNKLFKYRKK